MASLSLTLSPNSKGSFWWNWNQPSIVAYPWSGRKIGRNSPPIPNSSSLTGKDDGDYCITITIRSPSSWSMCVPTRKTAIVKSKSFLAVASYILNKLSCHLSSVSTLPAFRKRFKHYLFRVPFLVIPRHPLTSCFVMSAQLQLQLRSDTPPPS